MTSRFRFTLLLLIILTSLLSCSSDTLSYEYHHIYPQQFRQAFSDAGINIDEITIRIKKSDHSDLHIEKYNDSWKKFFSENKKPSKSDIKNYAIALLKQSGFKGKLTTYDYKKKDKATGILLITNNRFLGFAGKFGTFLMRLFSKYSWGAAFISFLTWLGTGFLGFFGIKVGQPVAVGIGFILLVVCIIGIVGIIAFFPSIMALVASLGATIAGILGLD